MSRVIASIPVVRTGSLSRGTALLFAVACGVAVGNVYLPQPLLGLMAADPRVAAGGGGLIATSAQLGYAVGIVFLVPLGDLAGPRRLVTTLLSATAACMAAGAVAPTAPLLALATLLAGVFAVVPQILLPLASHLAHPRQAGRVVAMLVTGLMGGIFGSRLLGSLIAQLAGWRAAYATAAVLVAITAVLLRPALTARPIGSPMPYPRLLAGLPGLFRRQPVLRQACLLQLCVFLAFSATWTVLALYLTGPRFGWSTGAAGLFGAAGLAAALLTPVAGRRIDRHGPVAVTAAALLISGAAVVILTGAGTTVAGLAVGVLALTAGMQSGQVCHQNRIFADRPDARSRVNTLCMASAFVGGSVGSAAGTAVYAAHGWLGVCVLDAIAVTVALVAFLPVVRREGGHAE
ncbi:MFS transporter [Microtetraspora sp. NBRC 13810]|uniref:MFS transporter n=1 Tax=Microtetraspora sp. NBRC 13810 TaxID=3030990 RepID=UPI0024A32AFB|nr:MFS transporter [Microtetraspora sp. NBRC 13810]GLW06524.1 MFS transporter [Microtetraspora sp. NBRC 13810]